ncbi:MAG: hypothetical protein ACM3X6_02955 [Patescibacteria group bacterium]
MKLSNRHLGQFVGQLAMQLVSAGFGRAELLRLLYMDRSTAGRYMSLARRDPDPFPCAQCAVAEICPAAPEMIQARAAMARAARRAREHVESVGVCAFICRNFEPIEGGVVDEGSVVDLVVDSPGGDDIRVRKVAFSRA